MKIRQIDTQKRLKIISEGVDISTGKECSERIQNGADLVTIRNQFFLQNHGGPSSVYHLKKELIQYEKQQAEP